MEPLRSGRTGHSCGPQQGSDAEFTQCGTKLPFAHAAFANAENARIRSGGVSAVQRIFRLRTFERPETGKIQTAISLQPGPTFEERTNQPFAHASIAGAASVRTRGGKLAAQQYRSPKRSLPISFEGLMTTVPSLQAAWTQKTRDNAD